MGAPVSAPCATLLIHKTDPDPVSGMNHHKGQTDDGHNGIVPVGPLPDFVAPHGREHLGQSEAQLSLGVVEHQAFNLAGFFF